MSKTVRCRSAINAKQLELYRILVNGVPGAELCSATGRAKRLQGDVPTTRWDMSSTGKIKCDKSICKRTTLTLGANCCVFEPINRAKRMLTVLREIVDYRRLQLRANELTYATMFQ